MQIHKSENNHVVVINRGEELIAQLTTYALETGVKNAWLGGLGGGGKMTLGFYDLETKSYEWTEYDQPLEILNLTGNLSWVDDKPFWHVHGNFSGRDLKAFGGHVKELRVELTCEVMITPLSTSITRTFDDTTGLNLLH